MSNGKDAQMAKLAQAKPVVVPTEYMVLAKVKDADGDNVWQEIGKTKAVNQEHAIRNLAGDDPKDAHVAVPTRSWRPVKPVVKVETRVVWA